MSNTKSIAQAYCGCPVRPAAEIRGDATDTMTEHVDGCTAGCDAPVSEMWECPNGCGLHIKDGPVPDGEPTIDEEIRAHLELCDGRTDLVDASGLDLIDLTAVDATVNDERRAYTEGLRQVADWLDAHPEVELPYLSPGAADTKLPGLPIYLYGGGEREQMATIARAMADGGRAEKRVKEWMDGSSSMHVWRQFAGLVVYAQAERGKVCERVVKGTREVTEQVQDAQALAAVPMVSVTKTVEDVEWVCHPLLADLPGGAA